MGTLQMMKEKLELHRIKAIQQRHAKGLFGVAGRQALLATKRGAVSKKYKNINYRITQTKSVVCVPSA